MRRAQSLTCSQRALSSTCSQLALCLTHSQLRAWRVQSSELNMFEAKVVDARLQHLVLHHHLLRYIITNYQISSHSPPSQICHHQLSYIITTFSDSSPAIRYHHHLFAYISLPTFNIWNWDSISILRCYFHKLSFKFFHQPPLCT